MRIPRAVRKLLATLGIALLAVSCAYFYATSPHRSSAPPESAEGLLDRADAFAWGNRWADALPLYQQAQQLFTRQHAPSRALYAEVSQIPPNESVSVPATLLRLTKDLARPEAADPETRLRILTIRGMLETNYDASAARATWQDVEAFAIRLRHYELATRATGEQGIAAFILGDIDTAKRQVVRAWFLSKVERDPAATVRYASVFGAGLVQVHRFKEALTPLDQAIAVAQSHSQIASPTIAIYAKIDALTGLHRYDEATALANASLARLQGTYYDAHKAQVYLARGTINKERGDWNAAIADYQRSVNFSNEINNYRGLTDGNGLLAHAYLHRGDLPASLAAINSAIAANTHIPDELYLVPRNLAIKAEIVARMGRAQEADSLYQKAVVLVDGMIQHAATVNVQRQLLAEMGDVYSGYFALLCVAKRYDDALRVVETVRGRVETETLEHHVTVPVHAPTPDEQELTRLNLALINTDDPQTRAGLTEEIEKTELQNSPSALAQQTTIHPVHLAELQRRLSPNALLVEYVLAERNSYAFAITHTSATAYPLPAKAQIESDASLYRKEIHAQKVDVALAERLFGELLAPISEIDQKTDLIIVPDQSLHLLPFAALADAKSYLLKSHTVDIAPSATVFALLQARSDRETPAALPYVGVAAWTQPADTRNFITRFISGPERAQLAPLPDSKLEVETIAGDLPRPNAILLGADATEVRFKHLSLSSTEVIHLALHGYADLDYPDRSALIFAPDSSGAEDGLLQAREIRRLPLKAKLVTLSACNTGVGPVGEAGVANLVNAFIEAGADSVVSTLWELEDHATEHLMTLFYYRLAHHDRKVDALRTAQLDFLNQGLPPYFWAGVQLVGDPDGTL